MGRYDFRAIRVRQTAKALFDSKRADSIPLWYNTVGDIPPAASLARPVLRTPRARGRKQKPSRMFQPMTIKYEEDGLRQDFFGDHPWELARPRLVVEDRGNDAKGHDWSRIVQPGKQLDGESVVQRQMWLMKHKQLSKPAAYDQARKEFYHYRHLEAIRTRVAKEEALHVGAYFGKGPLEIGMELEDRSWESWKFWASKQIEDEESMRSQMFSGPQANEGEVTPGELDAGLDELQPAVPQSKEGQPALGGAAWHP